MNSNVMTSIEYADIEDRITSISSDALIELFAIVIGIVPNFNVRTFGIKSSASGLSKRLA